MIAATEQPASRLCTACFDGNYPIELPGETALGKNVIEQMLATAARTGIRFRRQRQRLSATPSVAGLAAVDERSGWPFRRRANRNRGRARRPTAVCLPLDVVDPQLQRSGPRLRPMCT